MMVRAKKRDIPPMPPLDHDTSRDPEELGNYLLNCIEAVEWYGAAPMAQSSTAGGSCLDAIINVTQSDLPVTLTRYSGKEQAIIDSIARWGEFKTSISRALYYLYARNPKIDHTRNYCIDGGKPINCMSPILDVWRRNLNEEVRFAQILESIPAISVASNCRDKQSCFTEVLHDNAGSPNFIVRLLMSSKIDMTKDCGIKKRKKDEPEIPCIQQVYELETLNVFPSLVNVPEIRELLKYPIFISDLHHVPVSGYQYLLERLDAGKDHAPNQVTEYFKPRVGLIKVRFVDEDPHQTGIVFTNPLDYVMRVYATEDPAYPVHNRPNVLNAFFSNPEVAESVDKPFCRAFPSDDLIPCIDSIISSSVPNETMKDRAFKNIDLAATRCSSPSGPISCLEKAILSPGNYKYVKNAITSGQTNLATARCSSGASCLDMIINGTIMANIGGKLATDLQTAATRAAAHFRKPKEIDVIGVPLHGEKLYLDKAEAFRAAADVVSLNLGPLSKIPDKERTDLMNTSIRQNVKDLTRIECHTLKMGDTIGGAPPSLFVSDWYGKKVTEETLAQRIDVIKQSFERGNPISCMQRVFDIMENDPDSIEKSTVDFIVTKPDIDLTPKTCYDPVLDRPASCIQAAIHAAKAYGLHSWRSKVVQPRDKKFYELVPTSASHEHEADFYLDSLLTSERDLTQPACADAAGNPRACMVAILENKYSDVIPGDLAMRVVMGKDFEKIKHQTITIKGVQREVKSLFCKDTDFEALVQALYRMEERKPTYKADENSWKSTAGRALEIFASCRDCKPDNTFESRKCYDKVCFHDYVRDWQMLDEFEKDGDLYTQKSDILGVAGVYKVKIRGETDIKGAENYIKHVKNIQGKVDNLLSDPANEIKTKFKGKNAVVAYMGFFYPPEASGVFEKDIVIKLRYIGEDAEDYGKVLYETEVEFSGLLGRKSPFAKILERDPKISGEIKVVATSRPARKDTFLDLVLSRRGADFMRGSTCQYWASCITLNPDPSWMGAGSANGAALSMDYDGGGYMAYLARDELSPTWFARALVIPVDEGRKAGDSFPPESCSCADVETIKGIGGYARIMEAALKEVFYSKGINSTKNCPSKKFSSVNYTFGSPTEANQKMKAMQDLITQNCIEYYYNEKLNERMADIAADFEHRFGGVPPAGLIQEAENREGAASRRYATRKCKISFTREPDVDRDQNNIVISDKEHLKFVPPGGIRVLSWYKYLDSTGDLGYFGGRDDTDWNHDNYPINDAVHKEVTAKYGDDFVVRLRALATD